MCTRLEDHKQKLSAATDVVEQTDMLLTNVVQSRPGVISAKKSQPLAEGLPFKVQSGPKERQERRRKETTHEGPQLEFQPDTDWLENSSDDESEEPVLSLNNGDSSNQNDRRHW